MRVKAFTLKWGVALLLVGMVASLAQAKGTADVSNTVHNLSAGATFNTFYYTDEPEVCIFCHTPHGGSLTGPLWNKADPAPAGGFVFYASSTISTEVQNVAAVSPESMICLSCHDGSVSVNHLLNYGQTNPIRTNATGDPNTEITGTPGANPRIGGSPSNPNDNGQLADDHPISFSYRNVWNEYLGASKPGLKDPDSPTFVASDIRLFGLDERVECSTCHDPHVDYVTASPDHAPFLNMSNAGSALCLVCHDK